MSGSPALVVDFGSDTAKVGFSGTEGPDCFPALRGSPKYCRVFPLEGPTRTGSATHAPPYTNGAPSSYVGRDISDVRRGLLRLSRPVQHGRVVDLEAIPLFFRHFERSFCMSCQEQPLLLTEPLMRSRVERGKLAQVCFEQLSFPSLLPAAQPLLSLFATAKTSGCIMEVGEGITQTCCVVDGCTLPESFTREDLGGGSVTALLLNLMRRNGVLEPLVAGGRISSPAGEAPSAGFSATSSSYFDRYAAHRANQALGCLAGCGMNVAAHQIVRSVKEAHCGVAPSYAAAVAVAGHGASTCGPSVAEAQSLLALDQGMAGASCAQEPSDGCEMPGPMRYLLPDGVEIVLGPAETWMSSEALFTPSVCGLEHGGVADILMASLNAADVHLRKLLLENIVVSGGSAQLRGFSDRLLTEVLHQLPCNVHVRMAVPAESGQLCWIGGSLLAQLSSFSSMCISRASYMEEGEEVLHRRLFA